MSLQGPIVVIAGEVDGTLLRALESTGAAPVLGTGWDKAPKLVTRVIPSGIIATQLSRPRDQQMLRQVVDAVAGFSVFTPALICGGSEHIMDTTGVLPMAADASCEQIVARLGAAQRVRNLHAAAVRRQSMLPTADEATGAVVVPAGDPLDDATILVTGRGRSYPGLTTAVGERVGLIGALSVETAARYLNARDLDGIVIGDGFGHSTIAAFLTAMSEDARFRDLPIALVPELPAGIDVTRLPNLERLTGEPAAIVAAFLPLVRLHAFEGRLKRELASLDAQGLLDPRTGLFTINAFLNDLTRTIEDAQTCHAGLSLARFSFPPDLDQRASLDAARLVSRLVRSVDFGCRASDGSILVAFSTTALRQAHVIARRIASVLRHTMLSPAADPGSQIDASVTLASLKSTDTVESLLARVSNPEPVAAA